MSVILAGLIWLTGAPPAAAQSERLHPVAVSAHRCGFTPGRIEVLRGDLVKVTLTTEDDAHSFVIDVYRIAKRVNPGQSVAFEFHADQPGMFPYYSNLQSDAGCRDMRGQLVVKDGK